MSEQTVGQVLEDDHHVIDAHFATFAASLEAEEPDAAALKAGAAGLRHHIWVEETMHFPPLRAGGLMGPILVMLREHGQLWDLLRVLEQQGAAGAPAEARQTWAEFAAILEAHNAKEEQIVYPTGDELLSQEASDDVRYALESETMPDGWVCQMATT